MAGGSALHQLLRLSLLTSLFGPTTLVGGTGSSALWSVRKGLPLNPTLNTRSRARATQAYHVYRFQGSSSRYVLRSNARAGPEARLSVADYYYVEPEGAGS